MRQQAAQRGEAFYYRFSSLVLGLAIAATILFIWRRLTPFIVMLSGITGCIVAASPLDSLGQVDESPGVIAANPGDYWVEARAEELAAFALPGPAQTEWATIADSDSGWFRGAGVYRLDAGGDWMRVSVAPGDSLDDTIQTYDARR